MSRRTLLTAGLLLALGLSALVVITQFYPDSLTRTKEIQCTPRLEHRGEGMLYVGLWHNSTVTFKPGGPGHIGPDGSLSMKFWWTRGPGVEGKLTITGHRLDNPEIPVEAKIPGGYGDTGFQATALVFPGPGCYEITGKAGKASVTFTVRVVLEDA